MKKTFIFLFISIGIFIFIACQNNKQPQAFKADDRVHIEMQTSQGTLIMALYNETPKHRDNFVKLAEEGAFDSLLFHRVIQDFMIQGGDPDSKNASPGDTLGNGDRDYRVDAEFRPHLFHKKGSLAAARDGNIERASSAMQFYLVQGKVFNDSLLQQAMERINAWSAVNAARADTVNKSISEAFAQAMEIGDMEQYKIYSDSLKNIGIAKKDYQPYQIPQEHIKVYKTIGGTPHLDQNYTVFGEVIKGLNIIDIIAALPTDDMDRPVEDVRILKVTVLN